MRDTVRETEAMQVENFSFSLQYLNGSEIILPDSAGGEDITAVVDVPGFTSIDYQQQAVNFGDPIASAVTFHVMQGDSTIAPAEFDTPVGLKMAIPPDLPDAISNSVNDFILAHRKNVNSFVTTGIQTQRVDSANGTVSARVSHFFTIAMTPEANPVMDIKNTESNYPLTYRLKRNYPNPFNPTTIRYRLKNSSPCFVKGL